MLDHRYASLYAANIGDCHLAESAPGPGCDRACGDGGVTKGTGAQPPVAGPCHAVAELSEAWSKVWAPIVCLRPSRDRQRGIEKDELLAGFVGEERPGRDLLLGDAGEVHAERGLRFRVAGLAAELVGIVSSCWHSTRATSFYTILIHCRPHSL